jgi:hypothetical protein
VFSLVLIEYDPKQEEKAKPDREQVTYFLGQTPLSSKPSSMIDPQENIDPPITTGLGFNYMRFSCRATSSRHRDLGNQLPKDILLWRLRYTCIVPFLKVTKIPTWPE